ncbi:MAG: polyprenyl synthetase family protein [Patescibacteria group bacterium]|nr:polyprenyl synthetase family protein [Patescibacteria group bacterium]
MEKELYKKLMIETSVAVGPIVLKYLEPLKKENRDFYEICIELVEKKIGTFETREYFMRMAYEACLGKKWNLEIKHACAAMELELAHMYYCNRIFDEKGGEVILGQPNSQFMAGIINHDLASQALTRACSGVDLKTFKKIRNIFDEINKIFLIGQYIEVYSHIYSKDTKINFNKLMAVYYKRDDYVNNSFFEKIGIIGGILGRGTKKQIEALTNFGRNYGMMLQIINDIGDFVPPEYNLGTEEKLPQDAYSDIRHGKLTIPIIYCLTHGSSDEIKLVKEALTNKNIESKKLIEVTNILVNNGSIDFAKQTAHDYASKAKKYLKIFPTKVQDLIGEMCFMAYSNRYYKELQKFKS